MSARDMFGEPMVKDPATTIRILPECPHASTEGEALAAALLAVWGAA